MPTFVAIDVSADQATLVTGEQTAFGKISILGMTRTALASEQKAAESEATNAVDANGIASPSTAEASSANAAVNGTTTHHGSPKLRLEDLVNREVDGSLATLPAQRVVFEYLSLPFNDEKRLNQIVPLQVQDLVPFEMSDFIVDSMVVGKRPDGEFRIVSSLAPNEDISQTLESLASLGADPKILSSRASAASALVQLFPDECTGNFALVVFTRLECSVAIFVDGELRSLREFAFSGTQPELDRSYTDLFRDIRCSVTRAEIENDIKISKYYMVGTPTFVHEVTQFAGQHFSALDLSLVAESPPELHLDVNEHPWAVGLFANEFLGRKTKSRIMDFRKGAFAYKPTWGNFQAALTEERIWIGFGLVWLLAWVITVIYTTTSTVSKIDDAIAQETAHYIAGTTLPYLRETTALEDKITELKDQLQGLGTLATLSPLQSIKEITTTIPPDLDLSIDAITVGHFSADRSGVSFSGTVANYPSVGRISDAFEKNSTRFCNVKVEPKGRGGSSRIKFSAEISFCE